jgi:hypothetical protein
MDVGGRTKRPWILLGALLQLACSGSSPTRSDDNHMSERNDAAQADTTIHDAGDPDSSLSAMMDGSDGSPHSGACSDAATDGAALAWNPDGASTLIDSDAGDGNYTYSYSPSIATTSPTSRHVFYCGDTIAGPKGPIHDHVMLSVGTLKGGDWHYAPPVVAFGPEGAPGYASFHTCDPSVVKGTFGVGSHVYSWAILFTATGTGTGQNQVGVAFSDAANGPWTIASSPLVSEEMEFGSKSSDWPAWGLGHPRAVSVDGKGKLWLFYKLGTGPEVVRTVDLSDANSPVFTSDVEVSSAGLPGAFHSGEFVYDECRDVFFTSLDTGTFNTTSVGPNVQPFVTVAIMSRSDVLSGTGTWQVLDTFGADLSGQTYNANSGIVRDQHGRLAGPNTLSVFFTVSDPSIQHGARGVFENRLWEAEGAL